MWTLKALWNLFYPLRSKVTRRFSQIQPFPLKSWNQLTKLYFQIRAAITKINIHKKINVLILYAMDTILYPFKVLWRIYFGLVFCATFILSYPLFFVLLSNEDWYGHAFKFKRLVSLVTITLTGVKVEVDKRYELDPNVPMVICPNHQSPLDIILIYFLFPH